MFAVHRHSRPVLPEKRAHFHPADRRDCVRVSAKSGEKFRENMFLHNDIRGKRREKPGRFRGPEKALARLAGKDKLFGAGQTPHLSLLMTVPQGRQGSCFMKYMQAAFFVAVFCFCKAACALGAGAFGLELGSDIDRYGHEARPVSERWELRMYEVTPPSPDARFDTYAVDTFQGRIIRIMASSADDPSAEASKTLDVFESLKPELMEKYGEPSLNVEDVEDAGSDLRSYLVDEGGMEVLEWTFSATASSDGPGAVYVFLAGSETDDGKQARRCSVCCMYSEGLFPGKRHERGEG